jgi:hypothetical protein
MVFMVVAAHGFAARHGLVRAGHGQTVESVSRKSDRECYAYKPLSTPHAAEARCPRRWRQGK